MLLPFAVQAQQPVGSLSFKPEAGITFAKISTTTFQPGATAGFSYEYQITPLMGLSAGLNYTMQHTKYPDYTCAYVYTPQSIFSSYIGDYTLEYIDDKVKLGYIGIPILAHYYFYQGLALKAGLQPAFLVRAKRKATKAGSRPIDEDIRSDLNVLDIAIPLGLSYEWNNGLYLEGRYHIGITKINKHSNFRPAQKDGYRSLMQLSVGYRLKVR